MADQVNGDRSMVGWFNGTINGVLGIWHFNIRVSEGRMTWVVDGEPTHESLDRAHILSTSAMLDKVSRSEKLQQIVQGAI